MAVRPLYLMISRTGTGIGRMIRAVSRYPYNHVSLSLDPELKRWVSFARYAEDIPLYGGFITESPERYLAAGEDIQVKLFRLEIEESRAQRLEALFSRAGNRDFRLIYNTYDAIAAALGCRLPIPNAYTCLSFACAVLELPCRSIRELDSHLQPRLCYEGPLSGLASDSGNRTDAYFTRLGLLLGTWNTARHFALLSGRAFLRRQRDLVDDCLQRTHFGGTNQWNTEF